MLLNACCVPSALTGLAIGRIVSAMSQRRDDFTVFAQLAEPECLLNLSPDLYAYVENELFGSLGQPCDASCPWTWRAQRVRVEYPLGGHSIAR